MRKLSRVIITINGSKRESVGKSSTKALRNAGKVPCVLYGGEKPVHFSADEISFSKENVVLLDGSA